jgi:SAM-dependent methyltransferase
MTIAPATATHGEVPAATRPSVAPSAQAVYDDAHVTISRLLGRTYNNPLGERTFPSLRGLIPNGRRGRVLDVGCGRGATTCWWAARGYAAAVGLDPSPAMLAEARAAAARFGVSERATFVQSDLVGYQAGASEAGERFDLVLFHDVLCYTDDPTAHVATARELTRPGALISVTDYHGTAGVVTVDAVAEAWGIRRPAPLDTIRDRLTGLNLRVRLMRDSTDEYARHWADIGARLTARRPELEEAVGAEAVARFAARIPLILDAVEAGHFGHFWMVLEVLTSASRDSAR